MDKKCIVCNAKAIYIVCDKYMTKEFYACEKHIDEIMYNKIGTRNTVNIKSID